MKTYKLSEQVIHVLLTLGITPSMLLLAMGVAMFVGYWMG